MASKSKIARKKQASTYKRVNFYLISIPLIALLVKVIIQINIQNGVWLGADGENYLAGVNGLIKDGLFSKESKLLMWPAGYPLIILLIAKIHLAWVLPLVGFLQSALYSFSVYYFVKHLQSTRLAKFAILILMFLLFNPTLSLSSLAVGYESLVASGHLLIAALWLKSRNKPAETSSFKEIILSSMVAGLIVFMQPRLITTIAVFILIWIFMFAKKKSNLAAIAIGIILILLFPFGLAERNHQANGLRSISTNLGYTMNIGYGDSATGRYSNGAKGVPCTITATDAAGIDNEKVGCVFKWVIENPTKTLTLSIKKAFYFWSPWSGPVANGTMARNPWLKINPISKMAQTQEGFKSVNGNTGKFVGWLWLLGGLALTGLGFIGLWRMKGTERILGIALGSSVFVQMFISMATIGDHRFRLPIMAFSLVLQAAGILTLFRKLPARSA
jgi:hypothetical protein